MTALPAPARQILRSILNCPTAPFRQQHVSAYIRQFCADRKIPVTADAMGNLIAVYGRGRPDTCLAFCAHMDHPGFIITADASGKTARAVFYGGVEDRYFKNTRVRIFTESGPVHARILSVKPDKPLRRKHVRLSINAPVRRGDIGMWDLPACQLRSERIISRACDDGVGCAALLCLLDELHQKRFRKKVTVCFTVAEEAGLHGAKYLCTTAAIAKTTRIISVETSAVLPTAKMGSGVVVRVGDRSGIFDPSVTEFLLKAAAELQTLDKAFRVQRKLMDAGTCEASVFSRFGYRCGAICIPLGNYHNRSLRTGRIASEYVAADDFHNMIKLFWACVQTAPGKSKAGPPRYKTVKGDLGEHFLW